MQNKSMKYYEAYEERYKTAHQRGVSWAYENSTPIVMDTITKYKIQKTHSVLEIGCGEGRDSKAVLDAGFDLMATDISAEAIAYCRKKYPLYEKNFNVLDCLSTDLDKNFDFIYSVAVIHMLVLDEDRDGFYQFILNHLNANGMALICTMGDGNSEMKSDINRAFEVQERNHESGKMMVAATSCRMVSFSTFEAELARNRFKIIEKGITSALPDFNNLMYAVVERS
nr:class I SAM-dependent methyltransferase [uncultured Butyrivibrio sp.]